MSAPSRPRVPPSSCLACRVRRRKCDLARPACSRCASTGNDCRYPEGGTWEGRDREAGPPRRKKACKACRLIRKSCEAAVGDQDGEPKPGDGPCARCLERGIECVFPAPGEKGFRTRRESARRSDDGDEDVVEEEGFVDPEDGVDAAPCSLSPYWTSASWASSSEVPTPSLAPAFGPQEATSPAEPKPAAAPTLTMQFLLSLLPDFFDVADALYPVFDPPTFLAGAINGTLPDLPLKSVLLAALRQGYDNGDPRLRDGDAVRATELSLFADVKRDVSHLAGRGIRSLPFREQPAAVGALVCLIAWCHNAAMLEAAREMAALAAQWAREALLAERGKMPWEDRFAELLGAPDEWTARAMPLSPPQLRALRAEWAEHILPTRLCVLLANMAGQRRDWTRREEPVLHELLNVRATPCYAVIKASEQEDWDARTAPPVPPMSSMVSWMSLEPGSPARRDALPPLSGYILGVRNALPVIYNALRARADAFLAECLAAGVRTPFLLGSGAAGPHESSLLALRARTDAAFLDAISACPAAARGDAAGMVRALEPAHGFYHAWGQVHYFSALKVMRLEMYSSFGVFLLESEVESSEGSADAGGVVGLGEAVADEMGAGGVLTGLLADVSVFMLGQRARC
ncbi:hypothetical protein DFJ74DRAFT_335727 [Hyaloraphidium curvatum]|nr:hypothetical protein DFJ74DRAFT_335727 [Hyaloraphidium curvatum]